jgi:hypothetical protein
VEKVRQRHELEQDARPQIFRTHPPSRWLSLPARPRKHTHAHRLAHTHTPPKCLTLDCTLHTRAAHATLALNPLCTRPTASHLLAPHENPSRPALAGIARPAAARLSSRPAAARASSPLPHTARCGPRLFSSTPHGPLRPAPPLRRMDQTDGLAILTQQLRTPLIAPLPAPAPSRLGFTHASRD